MKRVHVEGQITFVFRFSWEPLYGSATRSQSCPPRNGEACSLPEVVDWMPNSRRGGLEIHHLASGTQGRVRVGWHEVLLFRVHASYMLVSAEITG